MREIGLTCAALAAAAVIFAIMVLIFRAEPPRHGNIIFPWERAYIGGDV